MQINFFVVTVTVCNNNWEGLVFFFLLHKQQKAGYLNVEY